MKKKPIALLLTDTHLRDSNIELVKSIWQQAKVHCLERNISTIYFLGDFFDSRKGQPLSVLKAAQEILLELKVSGILVQGIAGNHDKANYDSPDSFLDIISSADFQIYRESKTIITNELAIHFLSYFNEKTGAYLEHLEKTILLDKRSRKNILLTHVGINGSITNDNEHIDNCIPSNMFVGFDKVFVGHFHNFHEFENICYIGSAYQANFGEDDRKGFTILFEDGSTEFIQSNFPKYIKEVVNINDLEEYMMSSEFLHEAEGNHARIELVGSSEQLKAFDRSLLTSIGIEPVLKPTEAIISLDEAETTTYDKNTLRIAFKEFCKENEVEPNNYANKKLEEL